MIFNLSKLRIPLDDSLQNKSTGVSAQGPKDLLVREHFFLGSGSSSSSSNGRR